MKKLAIYALNSVIVTTHIFLGMGQADAAGFGTVYQYFENDKAISWDIDEPNAVVTDSENPAGVKKYDCRIYNDASDVIISKAFIHGLVDSGVDVAAGVVDFIGTSANLAVEAINVFEYKAKIQYLLELAEELEHLDANILIHQIESATNQTMAQIDGFFVTLDQDLSGCLARQAYTYGRLTGVGIEIALPAGAAVKALTRVKLINKIKNLSYLTVLNHFDDANLNKILNKNNTFLRKIVEDEDFRIFLSNSRDADRYEHIFYGDAGGGWHYRPTGEGVNGNEILEITRRNPNTGAYDARVMINGVPERKTFFPDHWSEEEVIRAINEGLERVYRNDAGDWVATVRNIEIRYNLDANMKIRSAFPNQATILN